MNDEISVEKLESLIAEFKDKLQRGENPSVLEYAEKNPELYAEIVEIFPTIESMEEFKSHREHSNQLMSASNKIPYSHLGEYRIIKEIGRGGMGIVYEAVQESLNRSVAVKVLPWLTHADESAIKRFNQEAQLAASLEHPNIIPIFGFGTQDNIHYYAMRYVRGVGLEKLIYHLRQHGAASDESLQYTSVQSGLTATDQKGFLKQCVASILEKEVAHNKDQQTALHEQKTADLSTVFSGKGLSFVYKQFPSDHYKEIAGLISQIARALHNAHNQGALHRDIKPANLLLDTHGVLWLTDFGIAKMMDSDTLTVAGGMIGTMRYIAPEQFDGKVETRSDIYSLGLVLYELITLQPAFTGQGGELMGRIVNGKLTPPQDVNPYVPVGLQNIVLKAVAPNVDQRYGSGLEMAEELDAFQQGIVKTAQHPPILNTLEATEPKQVEDKYKFVNTFGTIVLVVAIVVLLLMLFYGPKKNQITLDDRQAEPVLKESTSDDLTTNNSISPNTNTDSPSDEFEDSDNDFTQRRKRLTPYERRRRLEDNRQRRDDRPRDEFNRRDSRRLENDFDRRPPERRRY